MTKKFKRRDLILSQASRLFTEKGFSAVTLEEIAEAVGIKRESLYYYYPGKYDLLYDIIEPQIANVMDKFSDIVGTQTDLETAIRQGIENHLQHFNPSYLHMAMAIRKNSKDDIEQKFIHLRDMFKSYENIWINLIDKGSEQGVISRNISPKMMTYSILGLCNSLSGWYQPDGGLSLNDIGKHYGDIILDGIVKQK
ncbi:MAG: TetR/AcrR family transcriptional regulator [Emcibacter sp.]|nr:TetR/AcrR family transcriptional regulator [Emcibacter sp.]